MSTYSQKPTPIATAVKSWPACTRVCVFKSCLSMEFWLCRRPATPSAESRGSDIESVFSASSQKLKPFITAVKSRPAHDKVSDWLRKDSYGQVPDYLMERHIEMAAQPAEEEVCSMMHPSPGCQQSCRKCIDSYCQLPDNLMESHFEIATRLAEEQIDHAHLQHEISMEVITDGMA